MRNGYARKLLTAPGISFACQELFKLWQEERACFNSCIQACSSVSKQCKQSKRNWQWLHHIFELPSKAQIGHAPLLCGITSSIAAPLAPPVSRLLPPPPVWRSCLSYNLVFDQDNAFLHKQVRLPASCAIVLFATQMNVAGVLSTCRQHACWNVSVLRGAWV